MRIGSVTIAVVHRLILRDLHLALTAFFVAVAGTATRGAAECRIVPTTIPTSGAITTVFASPFSFSTLYIPSISTKQNGRAHCGVEQERSGAKWEARRNKCREEVRGK